MNKRVARWIGGGVATVAAFAGGTAEAAIDLSGVATDITTDISSAIPIGLGIMGLTFGIIVVKKAFKAAAR